MQNIKIEINGVQRNLEPMENQKKDNCSLFFIEGKWYREDEEKDYEILAFRSKNGQLWEKREDGLFITARFSEKINLISMLEKVKNETVVIHSVKRLSDGEVFTVGDAIRFLSYEIVSSLESILLSDNKIILHDDIGGFLCLKHVTKVKQPTVLLTTNEGTAVTNPEQQIFACHKDFSRGQSTAGTISKNQNNVYFAHAEARDEYIFKNKPVSISYAELTESKFFTPAGRNILEQLFKRKQSEK